MSEYKPLELSPAVTWMAAQAVTNPKAVENDHTSAELYEAMPAGIVTYDSDEQAQVGLFGDIFDNQFMRVIMRVFWFTYRMRKALGEIRSVNGPWDD